jgi:hypothetical protein
MLINGIQKFGLNVLKNTAAAIQRDLEEAEANKLYPQSYDLKAA